MQNKINRYIDAAITLRQRHRKTARNLCALALLVALGIFWQMRITGITMSDTACCGKPEHTHTESCLGEKQLVCGYPEIPTEEEEPQLICQQEAHSHEDPCYTTQQILTCEEDHEHTDACYTQETVLTCEKPQHVHDESCWETVPEAHVHTEACYEQSYICGLEAHTHTLACYSDPKVDLKTARDWEDTLPELLDEDRAEALVSIALSQIGYRESEDNFVLDEGGTSIRGITRYGQWYGNPYGQWDAMFVSFCLHYAGVEETELPYNSGSYAWSVQLREAGALLLPGSHRPDPGDLVFFDTDEDEKADHVGIVAEVEAEILTVIEGGRENRVDSREYAVDDPTIYALVPIPAPADAEPEQTVSVAAVELYTDDSWLTPLDSGSAVTVTGVLPEGITAKAFPVPLEMEGQEVLWAYDIRLFTPDGEPWEPTGDTLTVRVETPELLNQEQPGLVSVYYISEDGSEERIPSSREGDSLNFSVPHFSVYAAARAEISLVIDERALRAAIASGENPQLGASFQVNSSFSISDTDVTLDLNGYTLTMGASNSLFEISGGSIKIIDSKVSTGTETLAYTVTTSEIIDFATGKTSESVDNRTATIAGKIVGRGGPLIKLSGGTFTMDGGAMCNGTGRAIEMTGGTANLSGGYIYGFKKTGDIGTGDANFGGAILVTGGTLNISGTVLAKNEALNGGAIYAKGNSVVNITGGVIAENKSTRKGVSWDNDHSEKTPYRCGGGGIYTNGNTQLTMSGGYITNNTAADEAYFDGGGGVLISGTTTFTLDGGYITGNEAAGGGGIRSDWNKETTFIMNGGFVSGNTARTAEGGGIAITQGGTGEINGGYITNNTITNTVHWGGGGLFCSDGAYLRVYHVLVTENSAGGFGGGVAGCSTGRVYICVKDGGAIYSNDALGTNLSGGGSQKNEDHTYAADSPIFMANGYDDYFCALNSLVEGGMLGGGTANWSGSMDGVAISNVPKDAVLEAAYVMGLTSHPSNEDIVKAQGEAKVFINGNSSYTHGGGILCNGYLLVGDKNPIAVGSRLTLSGSKKLVQEGSNLPLNGYSFQFSVMDENEKEVSLGTSDQNGNIIFDRLLSFTEELCSSKIEKNGGTAQFQYYLTEVADPNYPEIVVDNAQYKITVTIQREDKDTPFVDSNGAPIVRVYYKITGVTVQKSTDGGETWTGVGYTYTPSNDEQHAGSLKITNNTTFTNEKGKTTSLAVKKKWIGTDGQPMTDGFPDSITVDLLKDGVKFGNSVELNAGNGWYHIWPNLTYGPTYTVKEHPVPGYETNYITGDPDAPPPGWYKADTIEEGGVYLLVSADGYALKGSPATNGAYDFGAGNWVSVTVSNNFIAVSDSISDEMKWEAVSIARKDGLYLKNLPSDKKHYLSYQNTDTVKASSGDTGYASRVESCAEGLRLYKHNSTTDIKYVVKPNTGAPKASDSNDNTLYLYKLSGSGNQENITTITNTKKANYYGFNLLKVDSENPAVVLAGAEFQLKQEDTVCTFTQTESGYLYGTNGTVTTLTTDEKGELHVDGLPAGTYTLVETKAPEGYEISEDSWEIELPTKDGQTIQVENVRKTYVLPETGGGGVAPLIFIGLLFMAVPVMAYKKEKISK